ncbi:SDR family oxidoreductase [Hephaestia sp. GCM10023244]|uniref:SDR family oxidoreductase n=1 Tax=unclassified Hephaestia TaxID=2631281 RepID=UPI002076E194|nr:SDR family oxidoreductase [Hephaestia sp. MAHUQ-44]MCM8730275.1 SDR family oxidoreductase [Hephaestia sp. MAHUQ-44]
MINDLLAAHRNTEATPAQAAPAPNRLAGKRALITGAGQGIGRETAALFAAQGATVWASDLHGAALEGLDGCIPIALDVTDAGAVQAIGERVGAIDILFNCAGMVVSGTVLDCSDDDWARSLDVNVTAMFRLIRAFLPGMIARNSGSIINMASIVGAPKAAPNRCAYGMSKAAVVGLTKSVAADYVTQGIRCNAICPGTIETPSLHDRLRETGDFEGALAAFRARQPMGRLGQPQEIAALALYLASDESAFMTGQSLMIDGGWSA